MTAHKPKIAIFASGSGSNAENIINHAKVSGDYLVQAVFCNKKDAYVLERAKRLKVPSYLFTAVQMKENIIITDEGETTFTRFLEELGIDYIILAGFLLKIPEYLINKYPDHILNIHPALLPAYGGKGMYGEHVHKAVIEAREKKSGITIHLVDNHYDHGETIYQATCDVTEADSPESLATKIHELECAYPLVISSYIKKKKHY